MKCPECLFENDVSAHKCMNCGRRFRAPQGRKPAKRKSSCGYFWKYFEFRTLITPIVIKSIYMLGSMVITFAGLIAIVSPEVIRNYGGGYIDSLSNAILLLLGGNLVWRILCEGAILLFSLHEILTSMETRYEQLLRRLS